MLRNSCVLVCLPMILAALLEGRILGQETPDPVIDALDARVAQFLEGVSLGQTPAAYHELLAGSQLLKQTEALAALVAKTDELKKKYGRYREFERIAAKRVGTNLVLSKYLYKCEDFPVVWYFAFYRTPAPGEPPPEAKSTWRVISVRFDTQLEPLAW